MLASPVEAEPRVVCPRCRRPASVCYCRHVSRLETATRVVLLQHPRERDVPIGTAHMASLCLPNSELHVGVHFRDSAEVRRALTDPLRPAALLYPGAGAVDVLSAPPTSPITLVVVDGTWAQAKKVVRENPELAALPRYAFTPPTPSEYRIRKEPRETYVSTIEALMHVLGVLEGDTERFTALLAPFRAMVEAQLAHARAGHGRGRHKWAPRAHAGPRVPPILGDRRRDLVCVVAEANAWPFEGYGEGAAYPDELVQWAACRPASGERFEAVIAPRNPPSPRTPMHLGISREELLAGESVAAFLDRWHAFVREDEVLCAWGPFARGMLASVDGTWSKDAVDLRRVMRDLEHGSVGTSEAVCARLGLPPSPPLAAGRAGARLAQLVGLVRHLSAPGAGG
jgi:DTW domain-containing protein YfiP